MKKTDEVISYIMQLIEKGELKSGNRLPSCRKLSEYLGLNKITVNRAYRQLEEEHKAYAIKRGGYYLADFGHIQEAKDEEYDFTAVKPDKRLMPYREFSHVINKAVELYKTTAFEYESHQGLYTLRQTLSDRLKKDGIYTDADNIIITGGAQQAIYSALQCLFNNGGKLLVEVPTYNLVLKQAEQLGIKLSGIERTAEGIDLNRLEYIFKSGEIRAFYIIPRLHNPTGYSLTEKDKRQLVMLAEKYKVMLIEDDYLADISPRGSLPLHYYADKQQVIYVRSFSKTFMPGLRLGFGVFPDSLVNEATEMKYLIDISTVKLNQAALELFISSGMYDKHVRKVRKLYTDKMLKASLTLKPMMSGTGKLHIPASGIFLWLEIPNSVDFGKAQQLLAERNIIIKSAEDNYLNGSYNDFTYIRLCISGVSDTGLNKLYDIASMLDGLS